MADTALPFTELTLASQLFVKNFYTEFNGNPTSCIVDDKRSRLDVVSKKGVLLCCFLTNVKNCAVASVELSLKKNENLLFYGHLLLQQQPQNLAFSQFSNPCLAVNCSKRNTCLTREYNLTGWERQDMNLVLRYNGYSSVMVFRILHFHELA